MFRIVRHYLPPLAVAFLACGVAQAQLFRAYLSTAGNDANPCTVAAPCRLLPAALNAVADGGEIWMLDSANFNSGAITINKNVNILAVPGQVGSIVAVGGANAININPGLAVSLRNVSIANNATSPGNDGIDITTGKLSVQDSTISVPNSGIRLTGSGSVSVHNTVIHDSFAGVYVAGGGTADISHSKFISVQYGVYADGNTASVISSANVRDCQFMKAVTALDASAAIAGASALLSLHDSSVSNGTYGVAATSSTSGASAIAAVGASTISNTTVALIQSGTTSAVLQSMGNNLIVNNTNNTNGTITAVGGT